MKNIENYLEQLEGRNGNCDCSELEELYSLRRTTEGLEGSDEFEGAARDYYASLSVLADSGKLKLLKHNLENEILEEIDSSKLKKDILATIHCSNCEQQIDVVEN